MYSQQKDLKKMKEEVERLSEKSKNHNLAFTSQ